LADVHLRNITGKAPDHRETFIDDVDVDALRVLEILNRNQFDGVIIPNHTPPMDCGAPWHAAGHLLWVIFAPRCKDFRRHHSFLPKDLFSVVPPAYALGNDKASAGTGRCEW
jgi:hypothetical protein